MCLAYSKIWDLLSFEYCLTTPIGDTLPCVPLQDNTPRELYMSIKHSRCDSCMGLGPYGDHNGVGGFARLMELDRDVAASDHFDDGEPASHGDVLQPHRQAPLGLYGRGVGAAGKSLQDSFFIIGCYFFGLMRLPRCARNDVLLFTSPPGSFSSRRGGEYRDGGHPHTPDPDYIGAPLG
jgi:hypothetical protein